EVAGERDRVEERADTPYEGSDRFGYLAQRRDTTCRRQPYWEPCPWACRPGMSTCRRKISNACLDQATSCTFCGRCRSPGSLPRRKPSPLLAPRVASPACASWARLGA